MALADNNPERRNLTITSLIFIVYYLAEGQFKNNIIKLPLVNIEFSNQAFLTYFAWVTLGWFLWRFWLIHHKELAKGLVDEIRSQHQSKFVKWYIKKTHSKAKEIKVEEIVYGKETPTGKKFIVRCQDVQPGEKTQIVVTGFRGTKLLIALILKNAFIKPWFSSYMLPYILAVTAIGLGIYHLLDNTNKVVLSSVC